MRTILIMICIYELVNHPAEKFSVNIHGVTTMALLIGEEAPDFTAEACTAAGEIVDTSTFINISISVMASCSSIRWTSRLSVLQKYSRFQTGLILFTD